MVDALAHRPAVPRARLLPDEPPPGWSVPYALRDSDGWALDAGEHGLLARLERTGGNWALRVYITTRGSHVPADDQRCAELLGHLGGLGEWLECVGVDGLPGTRVWLAIPRALQAHWEVPPAPPPPPAEAIPRLEAARAHLPEKLPEGWSVPVAMVDPHGFDWPHGAWMFAADDLVVMLSLWDERGPMKLFVAMFHPDGSDVEEGDAFDVLRHLREVHEFSPGKRAKDAPYIAYFGELEPKERPRATLN